MRNQQTTQRLRTFVITLIGQWRRNVHKTDDPSRKCNWYLHQTTDNQSLPQSLHTVASTHPNAAMVT
jgi:hypothetical protein